LWNSYSFFSTYATADGLTVRDLENAPALSERPEIDRWIISVLQSLIATFAQVAAPILPFITEEIYQGLVATVDPDAPRSVHHTDYPIADVSAIDRDLESAMADVRTIVTLGRGLRKKHDVRVRQPLESVTIVTRSPATMRAVRDHAGLIAEELNVHTVDVHGDEAGLVDLSARADFKVLGPRLGKNMKSVASGIAELDHATIASLVDGGSIDVDGFPVMVKDIVILREPRPGTIVATDHAISVALNTTIDEELRIEGIARELINRIQNARRQLDLEVSDRIIVRWMSDDTAIHDAFEQHSDLIAGEVLATEFLKAEIGEAEPTAIGDASVSLEIAIDPTS
jgi:isoleucyl-tRNA synthetase